MNLKLYSVLLASALAMGACSDKDNKEGGPLTPEVPGGGDLPAGSTYTPEQSKQFLTETANDVMGLFNPADQADAINVAGYFSENFADFELPEEFDFEVAPDYSPARFFRNLSRGARGDVDALSRATDVYMYHISFDRCTGVYEPNCRYEEWEKVESSNDIVFRFPDANGMICELRATKSGSNSEIDFTITDDDYYYSEEYQYFISLPHTVDVNLKRGSQPIFAGRVVSSVSVSNHTLNVETTASCANLAVYALVNGTDSQITSTTTASVNGSVIVTANAKLNGRHLCDKSYLENIDEDMLASMLNTAEARVDVMGRVQAYGNATYYDSFFDDLSMYYGYYDGYSQSQATSRIQGICDRLNSKVDAYLCYNNTSTRQAALSFVPMLDEWGYGYWESSVSQNLIFADGTSYNLESYFEKFTSVTSRWESLQDAYESAWKRATR